MSCGIISDLMEELLDRQILVRKITRRSLLSGLREHSSPSKAQPALAKDVMEAPIANRAAADSTATNFVCFLIMNALSFFNIPVKKNKR